MRIENLAMRCGVSTSVITDRTATAEATAV
jgi:hypothetical protein